MRKALTISATTLKMIIGMVFIFSAVLKFITIDSFEIYLYSFGFFSLTLSYYAARLVIACELLLGAALMSNRNSRFSILMTLLFLIVFIVFLAYAHIIGRTDSCHCFGDFLPLSPVQSILKNAVLVLLLIYVFKFYSRVWVPSWWQVILLYLVTAGGVLLYTVYAMRVLDYLSMVMILVMMVVGVVASFGFYRRWYVTTMLVLTPFVTTFILTPPDSWYYNGKETRFDKELFLKQAGLFEGETDVSVNDTAANELAALHLEEGQHILAFFSPNCGYCRLCAGKLSAMAIRNGWPEGGLVYLFPRLDDEQKYNIFYEKAISARFDESRIEKGLFLKITRGSFPLVLLVGEGEVKASYDYRNLDERELTDFLIKKQ
ncbi:MAG: hypothetical protein J6X58_04815 [Bacteroidales bacterium]|nr:hypothetical protein [Bacteroidales bacterium]